MAMYLGDCPVYSIMMIGRWSSDAFLRYIRKQVEQLIKPATAIEGSKRLSEMTSNGIEIEAVAEGLDALDMSSLELTEKDFGEKGSETAGPRVNGSITCKFPFLCIRSR